ncbi:MAG: ArnT family glycosyltransferase [Anaerolineae bacterium]
MMSQHTTSSSQPKQARYKGPQKPVGPADWLAGALLAALYLSSRWVNILALPIFSDESLHIVRARRMLAGGNFLQGTAAGKFLYIWLLAPALTLHQNPLLVARGLSAAVGLAGGMAAILLARALWPGRSSGWLTGLVYIFVPLTLMNERMALTDSLLATVATLILLLSLKAIQQPRRITEVALGLCLGAALLTKLSGLVYFAVPIAAVFFLRRPAQPVKLPVVPYLIAAAMVLPTVGESFNQFIIEATRSALNPNRSPVPALSWMGYGLGETWFDLHTYVTWPVLLPAAARLVVGWRRGERTAPLLVFLLVITPATYIGLARSIWFSRYLLPIAPIIVVLAAQALHELGGLLAQRVGREGRQVWQTALCLLCLLPALTFDYRLITGPDRAPFTPADRWQYVSGWPSGYGLPEAVVWLEQAAVRQGGATVVSISYQGPTREGMSIYLQRSAANVQLIELGGDDSPEESLSWLVVAQSKPLALLLNEPNDRPSAAVDALCPETLAVFERPRNRSRLVLRACSGGP